jgi:dsRNA-specific ribonuclease
MLPPVGGVGSEEDIPVCSHEGVPAMDREMEARARVKGKQVLHAAASAYVFYAFPNLRGELAAANVNSFVSTEFLAVWAESVGVASLIHFLTPHFGFVFYFLTHTHTHTHTILSSEKARHSVPDFIHVFSQRKYLSSIDVLSDPDIRWYTDAIKASAVETLFGLLSTESSNIYAIKSKANISHSTRTCR